MKPRYLLLILALVAIVSISGCVANQNIQLDKSGESFIDTLKNISENTSYNKSSSPNYPNQNNYQNYNKCSGTGAVNLTASPRNIEDIGLFVPMGLMIGDHVTPIDHGYFYPPNWKMDVTSSELKDVFVPADGIITQIGRMPDYFKTTKESDLQDYRIIIYHTCTFYTIYIHLNLLSPRIKDIIGEIKPSENKEVSIKVNAGELLGRANAFDFSVHNEDITLTGFITPKNYQREYWKIHTVDPFDYFIEPIRSQILAKNPRTTEPRGGKIDYDIDGKLIGNWFLEGTNGYAGIESQPNYWVSHLAFAPDAYDPAHFIISIGEFEERYSKQYAAKGNTPNPSDVSKDSGLVKYELVEFDYIDSTGKIWDKRNYTSEIKLINKGSESRGIMLVQILENRRLKIESFPGKQASEVSAFTEQAKIYER